MRRPRLRDAVVFRKRPGKENSLLTGSKRKEGNRGRGERGERNASVAPIVET